MKFGCQPAKRESIDRTTAAAVHITETIEKTRMSDRVTEVKFVRKRELNERNEVNVMNVRGETSKSSQQTRLMLFTCACRWTFI